MYTAAVEWGEPGGLPWLAVHGWADHAGSWAGLAAAGLPAGVRLVALELPGHGRSDPLPPGMAYNTGATDGVMHLQRAVKFLGWKRFTLLGHSRGAALAALYTAAFPERVVALVMLDMAGWPPHLLPGPLPALHHRVRDQTVTDVKMIFKIFGGKETLDFGIKERYWFSKELI